MAFPVRSVKPVVTLALARVGGSDPAGNGPVGRSRGNRKKVTRAEVLRMIESQTEWKFTDFSSSAGVDYSGTIIDVSTMAQGDSDTTRDGDTIRPKKLELRAVVAAGDTNNACRLLVVQWAGNDTVDPPTCAKIFQTTGGIYAPFSPVFHDNSAAGRVEVLRDYFFNVNASTTWYHAENISLEKCKPVQFLAGSTTNRNNGIYLAVISDSAAAAHPNFTITARLNYTDS